ncbi:GNAT family N-acetyltransferase [Blastopirellula marina]|uniref:Cellulose biosynthesis protein n=1 Tax=Blastopirellula marina TaxID=124 RepID=A0A2S8FU33_9BACT|nr:GNAT family N-acetyltransferase [Blastopirellula marina]PQO35354.1 cellulose biosynthesis protein [Blastopirellula marina]PTL43994.1 GNAT family N-acetyltransferase [Blastopirellula marina]
MLRVVEINEIEALATIRANWRKLWLETPYASFFHTLDWLRIYWRHFGRDQRLRVLIVLEGDQMVGVVPLTVVTETTRLGSVRVLTYPLSEWGSYYGPLGVDRYKVLSAAFRHIRETPRDWELFDLRWVALEDMEEDHSFAAMSSGGLIPHRGVWNETSLIDVPESWEKYLATRSPKFRSEIRRKTRRVRRQGRMEMIRYRPEGLAAGDGDPRWDLFGQAYHIALSSWQGSAIHGNTLSHPDVSGFFRETHKAAAELGMLDLCLIYVDGRPAAFLYNYHRAGDVYGLRRGSMPEIHELGIGTVATALTIEDSCRRGDRLIDLGAGSLHAKRSWMTRLSPIGRVTHYPSFEPKSQMLRLTHWWKNGRPTRNVNLTRAQQVADVL